MMSLSQGKNTCWNTRSAFLTVISWDVYKSGGGHTVARIATCRGIFLVVAANLGTVQVEKDLLSWKSPLETIVSGMGVKKIDLFMIYSGGGEYNSLTTNIQLIFSLLDVQRKEKTHVVGNTLFLLILWPISYGNCLKKCQGIFSHFRYRDISF